VALNFPGPYGVQIKYLTDGIEHVQNINCDVTNAPEPGETFDNITVRTKDGGSKDLDVAVDEWVALLAPFISDDTEFTVADLFEYTEESFERRWIASYELGVDGTSASAHTPAGEYVFTFRTYEGGVMQIRLEEGPIGTAGRFSMGAYGVGTPLGDLKLYLVGDNGWIIARDTSYPVQGLYMLLGQNEAIFKVRYR